MPVRHQANIWIFYFLSNKSISHLKFTEAGEKSFYRDKNILPLSNQALGQYGLAKLYEKFWVNVSFSSMYENHKYITWCSPVILLLLGKETNDDCSSKRYKETVGKPVLLSRRPPDKARTGVIDHSSHIDNDQKCYWVKISKAWGERDWKFWKANNSWYCHVLRMRTVGCLVKTEEKITSHS